MTVSDYSNIQVDAGQSGPGSALGMAENETDIPPLDASTTISSLGDSSTMWVDATSGSSVTFGAHLVNGGLYVPFSIADSADGFGNVNFTVDEESQFTLTGSITGNNLAGSYVNHEADLFDDLGNTIGRLSDTSTGPGYTSAAPTGILTGLLHPGTVYSLYYSVLSYATASGGSAAPDFTSTLSIAPVPEPTTLTLLAAPLALLRRRRR